MTIRLLRCAAVLLILPQQCGLHSVNALAANANKHNAIGGILAKVRIRPLEILWTALDILILNTRLTRNKIPAARTNAARNQARIKE